MSGGPNAVPLSDQRYALLMDNGYHEDVYREYPPEEDIEEARRAAPDAWTAVVRLDGGRNRFVIHQWAPINCCGDEGALQALYLLYERQKRGSVVVANWPRRCSGWEQLGRLEPLEPLLAEADLRIERQEGAP